jgi:hypothetical protein
MGTQLYEFVQVKEVSLEGAMCWAPSNRSCRFAQVVGGASWGHSFLVGLHACLRLHLFAASSLASSIPNPPDAPLATSHLKTLHPAIFTLLRDTSLQLVPFTIVTTSSCFSAKRWRPLQISSSISLRVITLMKRP